MTAARVGRRRGAILRRRDAIPDERGAARARRGARWLLPALSLLLLLGAGCGRPRTPTLLTASEARERAGGRLDERGELPDRLFERLQAEQAAGRDRAALALAYELIDHHPEYRENDRVLLLGARSARRAGDDVAARGLLRECLERHPDSRWRGEALALYAELATGETDSAGGSWAAGPAVAPAAEGSVDPTRVGLLLPLSGSHALVGRAIEAGARLAVTDVNRAGWRQFRLSTRDSEADALAAALAARRLITDEGVIGLIVAAPTEAEVGALVAAADFGTPLLALACDDDRLRLLGPTLLPGEQTLADELRLLVRAARRLRGCERFGLVFPDTPRGRRALELLTAAVVDERGRLVAAVPLPAGGDAAARPSPGAQPWSRLREARPDAVVMAVPIGDLPRLLPELAPGGGILPESAQLLGTSLWQAPGLAEVGLSHVEGALLPAEDIVHPRAWVDGFRASRTREGRGAGAALDDASRHALRGYLATRRLLTTIGEGHLTRRSDLAAALAREQRERSWLPAAPDELARLLLTVRNGRLVPYDSGG